MRTIGIALAFGTLALTCWAAAPDITLVANGRTIASDPAPTLHNNQVYVPLRVAAEAVGGKVDYDAAAKRVTICRGPVCTIVMQSDGITADGRLLVGIRRVAEALNATVDWDAAARTVSITTTD